MPAADRTRRERLVAAALEQFSSHGLRRTSIDDIAEAAGIAKGSVYLEFATKTDLFRAVAEQVAGAILADAEHAAASELALEAKVIAVLLGKFWRLYALVHSRPHARELVDLKDSVAGDVFRAADDRYAMLLESVLALRAWTVSARELAGVLLRTAHGTTYGGVELSASAYRKRLALAVELILAGATR